MGRLSADRSAGLDHCQMREFRLALYFVIGLCLGAYGILSHAAAVPMSGGSGVASVGGAFSTGTSYVGSFSAGAFNNNFTTNVAGRAVVMPASMRMAANAGSFAVNAVKMNPAGLIGTALAAWLIQYGIEYIDGLLQKKTPGNLIGICSNAGLPAPNFNYTNIGQGACQASIFDSAKAKYPNNTFTGSAWVPQLGGYALTLNGKDAYGSNFSWQGMGRWEQTGTAAATYAPATAADWAALPSTLPDGVADELARKGANLPLNDPDFNSDYVDVPLGDPYIDPVTGKRYQDKARVTPDENGEVADVQPYKQEVDENGDPATDPTTGNPSKPEETKEDECELFPDRVACLDVGETPEADDLEKNTKTISITPDSGWGPSNGSCPADLTHTTKNGGVAVAFSYKAVCTGAEKFRPLIIGMAWLSAILIMLGIGRKAE